MVAKGWALLGAAAGQLPFGRCVALGTSNTFTALVSGEVAVFPVLALDRPGVPEPRPPMDWARLRHQALTFTGPWAAAPAYKRKHHDRGIKTRAARMTGTVSAARRWRSRPGAASEAATLGSARTPH